jgi:hypothetical protein
MAPTKLLQRVAPAREIRADLQLLFDTLDAGMRSQERSQMDIAALPEITKLFESIMAYEYFDEERLVKSLFHHLSAGARKVAPSADWLRESSVSPGSLDAAESQFLDQLVRLLLLARFKPLSNTEWLVSLRIIKVAHTLIAAPGEGGGKRCRSAAAMHASSIRQVAQQEAFIFDIPVTVTWDALDPNLLRKLWAISPEHEKLREKFAPEVADRWGAGCRATCCAPATSRRGSAVRGGPLARHQPIHTIALLSISPTCCWHPTTARWSCAS